MSFEQMLCPNCDGVLLTTAFSKLHGSAYDGDRYEITCPHCSESFPIGYVSEFKKIEEAESTSPQPSDEGDEQEEARPEPAAEISGGGGGLESSSPTTSNDQRSNVMNPNNPASQAARDNRSNQMNPNSQAYRSSRRG